MPYGPWIPVSRKARAQNDGAIEDSIKAVAIRTSAKGQFASPSPMAGYGRIGATLPVERASASGSFSPEAVALLRARRIDHDGHGSAARHRAPPRRDGRLDCFHNERLGYLRGFERRRAKLGRRLRRKLQHSFTLSILVTHRDRFDAPLFGVSGPLGKSLEAPNVSLTTDFDLKLSALPSARHIRELARRARIIHPPQVSTKRLPSSNQVIRSPGSPTA